MADAVLVTGASSGLGLQSSIYLAQHGYRVFAGALDSSEIESIEKAATGLRVSIRPIQLDITSADSVREAVAAAVKETGGIYALVNNAGTRLRGCFEDLSQAEIHRLFETNVFGTMAMTRAVVPYMRGGRRGRIVMITSVAGKMGSFGVSAYCATKFAQEGFAESLSQELAPWNIRVIIIEPGIIKTEAWNVHRVVAAGAQNPESPYFDWFQRFEKLSDRMVETSSTTPLDVARVVLRAVASKNPRLRYMVGRRAKVVFALRRYFPGELFERLYFERIRRLVMPHRP